MIVFKVESVDFRFEPVSKPTLALLVQVTGYRVRSTRLPATHLNICLTTYDLYYRWLLNDSVNTMMVANAVKIDDGDDDFNGCTNDVDLDCSIDPKYRTCPRLPVSVLVRSPQKGQEMAGWCPSIPHVQQTCYGLRCATELHR